VDLLAYLGCGGRSGGGLAALDRLDEDAAYFYYSLPFPSFSSQEIWRVFFFIAKKLGSFSPHSGLTTGCFFTPSGRLPLVNYQSGRYLSQKLHHGSNREKVGTYGETTGSYNLYRHCPDPRTGGRRMFSGSSNLRTGLLPDQREMV
jgi:hypothetical protein